MDLDTQDRPINEVTDIDEQSPDQLNRETVSTHRQLYVAKIILFTHFSAGHGTRWQLSTSWIYDTQDIMPYTDIFPVDAVNVVKFTVHRNPDALACLFILVPYFRNFRPPTPPKFPQHAIELLDVRFGRIVLKFGILLEEFLKVESRFGPNVHTLNKLRPCIIRTRFWRILGILQVRNQFVLH